MGKLFLVLVCLSLLGPDCPGHVSASPVDPSPVTPALPTPSPEEAAGASSSTSSSTFSSSTSSTPAPADNATTTASSADNCPSHKADCKNCTAVHGCMWVQYGDESTACMSDNASPSAEGPRPTKFLNPEECDGSGESDITTIVPDTTSTTTTTTTTTSPDTTTETTSTTTTATTTTTPSTDTTTATTSTETPATTTAAPVTTQSPNPSPDARSGGGFSGWSFFGGILLTLGVAAIGFVGIKYYKLRSTSGANYNRF